MTKDKNPFEEEIIICEKKASPAIPLTVIGETLSGSSKTQIIKGVVPSKSNCYRIVTFKSKNPSKHSHSTLAKTKELKEYEEAFAFQCNIYRNKMIGEFIFEMDVYYPSKRADLDNSLKVTLDCLQKAGAIENDRYCMELRHIRRFVDVINPRIEFRIFPV